MSDRPSRSSPDHGGKKALTAGIFFALGVVFILALTALGLALFDLNLFPSPDKGSFQASSPGSPSIQLEPYPKKTRLALEAASNEILHTYGWTQQDKGFVHVPIDRAMELALKKAYPVRAESDRTK